jgi:hypothetical protein
VGKLWNEPTRDIMILDKVQFKLKKVNKYLKGWGSNLAGSRNRGRFRFRMRLRI